MELSKFLEKLRLLPEGVREDIFDILNALCDGEGDEVTAENEMQEVLSRFALKKATCMDNSHTWRNVLTIENEYLVLDDYVDSYGVRIFKVKGDDGEVRPYRADRFAIK